MAIARQGFGDAVLLHHYEGYAVRKCPPFAGPFRIQRYTGIEEGLSGRNDCTRRVGTERLDQLHKPSPKSRRGKGIPNFGQDPGGSDNRIRESLGESYRLRVGGVPFVQQGEEIIRIREERFHFLGVPWV